MKFLITKIGKNEKFIKIYRLVRPFFDPVRGLVVIPNFLRYLIQLNIYKRLFKKCEELRAFSFELFPQVYDATSFTKQDPHYFYQGVWAMKRIISSGIKEHFDIGSQIDFVRYLSLIVKTNFIDIRPIDLELSNLTCRKGSILNLPFGDDSICSISSLHVIEHIGLGRYGDQLDLFGSKKGAEELIRVLAPGGRLYISTPIGRPRICFNAHIIRTPLQVMELFEGLVLVEFSTIDDNRRFIENANPNDFSNSDYACGLFIFSKPHESAQF
jgi:SAM-dependent methyltransferase